MKRQRVRRKDRVSSAARGSSRGIAGAWGNAGALMLAVCVTVVAWAAPPARPDAAKVPEIRPALPAAADPPAASGKVKPLPEHPPESGHSGADGGAPAPPPVIGGGTGKHRPLDLRLPTDNRGLLDGHPETFFMGVDRTINDRSVFVWEGGQYGFVRNAVLDHGEWLFTRFHEGIDIAPTLRDNRGEPLDLVCSIGDGQVVFASNSAHASNYGNYVVIAHDWGDGIFYSLYGHLMRIDVQLGQELRRGGVVGRLGYTGSGIDRRRAHVHLELNLLINQRFAAWSNSLNTSDPVSSIFHGYNMVGLNIAELYKALDRDPTMTLPRFIQSRETAYYQVTAPNRGVPDILSRYPWLWEAPHEAPVTSVAAPSWKITFSAGGLPIRLEPSTETVPYPIVTSVQDYAGRHSSRTMGRVTGSGTAASLTPKGTDYVNLVLGTF